MALYLFLMGNSENGSHEFVWILLVHFFVGHRLRPSKAFVQRLLQFIDDVHEAVRKMKVFSERSAKLRQHVHAVKLAKFQVVPTEILGRKTDLFRYVTPTAS